MRNWIAALERLGTSSRFLFAILVPGWGDGSVGERNRSQRHEFEFSAFL